MTLKRGTEMAGESIRKVWFRGLLFMLLALTLTALISCERKTGEVKKEVIKIGFIGPLTGDAASYGLSIKRGVDLAAKEMGLNNVRLVYEDSRCEGKEAVTAVNKLISVDRVSAIIGEVCSGATLAAAPVAEQNGVVMISAASTSPKITDAGKYIFRTVPSDALQGDFGARLVYRKGYRRLAILYSNEEYGLGFNNVLMDSFTKAGGEVVSSETFERGSTDLRTQLTKIKSSKPDAIYIISNSPDSAAAALKQLKELGIDAALFGSEGLKSDAVIKGAGAAAEGLILTSVSSGTTDFARRHRDAYGEPPGPFAAQGYDAFKAIAITIKQGASTGQEIMNALAAVEFDGASGRIKFDENGDVSGNYDIYVVKDGVFTISD
jgi:branched-chain amino acid transport system substrate-binding protein